MAPAVTALAVTLVALLILAVVANYRLAAMLVPRLASQRVVLKCRLAVADVLRHASQLAASKCRLVVADAVQHLAVAAKSLPAILVDATLAAASHVAVR